MRFLISLAPLLFISVACAAGAEEGDVGDDTAFITGAVSGCTLSRDKILASAPSAGRKKAIQRGFKWFDDKVDYSQSKQHEGYRTDCSGFVSMCWELGTSLTTADFVADNSSSSLLGSYDELIPGDGMVRRSGGAGHAILFVGWNDSKHSGACVLEQASTALDMQFDVRTTASLKSSGFKAIRSKKLASDKGGGDIPILGPTGDDSTDESSADQNVPRPSGPSESGGPSDDSGPGGGGPPPDIDFDCILECASSGPAAKYATCTQDCQDQTCDDKCFDQACSKNATACEKALSDCGQQCGAPSGAGGGGGADDN